MENKSFFLLKSSFSHVFFFFNLLLKFLVIISYDL